MKKHRWSVRRGSFLDFILIGVEVALTAVIGWLVFRLFVDLLLAMTGQYNLLDLVLKNDVICGIGILATGAVLYLVWILKDKVKSSMRF